MISLALLCFLFSLHAASAFAAGNFISTWYNATDMAQSLDELREHSAQFASVSIFALGNSSSSSAEKLAWMSTVRHELGIETYWLWGGDMDSFYTAEQRRKTVAWVVNRTEAAGYAGVDLDFEHLPKNSTVTDAYSAFLRQLSTALHAGGMKLSACVGSYPTADDGISVFYDPAVINETVDIVRVMNYDMYYVGGRGVPALASRPDCEGMGPTSTVPWARHSMEWWMARVHPQKLVMGLPAYSNDYSALPGRGGSNGTQQGVGPPVEEAMPGTIETVWTYFDQMFVHRYLAASTGEPRVRYGVDVKSTQAQLVSAKSLGVRAVGFWTWNTASDAMRKAALSWR